jgi:spore germination cell wall hydrolase CwlJ-like protein
MTSRKLLAALIITILISFGFGRTAYASELSSVTDLAVDNGTESTEDSSVTEDTEITTDSADIVNVSNDEQVPEEVPEETETEEIPQNQDTAAEEGSSDINQQVDNNITTDESEDADEAEEPVTQDIPEVKPTYTQQDLRLLSCLIYAEAGNQSYRGMLAVANVVLNRVKSDVFWHVDTVKEVIYDRKWSVQFAVTIKDKKTGLSMLDKALKYYDTGKFSGANPEAEKMAMDKAIKAAKAALSGKNNIGNYLCFTNKSVAKSVKKKYSNYKIIGDQIFFRTK